MQENIQVRIREDGSRVVSRNIIDMGDAAERAERQIGDLRSMLAGLVAGATLLSLARMADTFTNLQNRLRLVTTDTANLARVTKELQTIANSTRSDFTATTELYTRLAASTKELGLSQQQMLNFTKQLNQAVVLSGASSEEAANGLRQLAQGLASGTLRGDELNSVLENFPKVADIIARGMGKTIGDVRKLGAEGKITATAIIDAFAQANDELERGFGTTVPTLGQSFTVLKNNFMVFIGQMDSAYGITSKFAGLIIDVANNLDVLVPILAGIATAVATAFSAAKIVEFAGQLRALWALALANPFVAVAAAVAGLVTTLYLMRDAVKLGIDDTTTLGDLMRAAWEQVVPLVEAAGQVIKAVFELQMQLANTVLGVVGAQYDELFGDVEDGWLGVVRVVARTVDAITGLLLGLARVSTNIFATVAATITNAFSNAADQVGALMRGDFAGVVDAGKKNVALMQNLGDNLGKAVGDAFDSGFGTVMEYGLEARLNTAIDRAKEIGKKRLADLTPPGGLAPGGNRTVTNPVDEKAAAKAAEELERLKKALAGVLDEADPVQAAQRRLAESQDILTRAVKAGLIEQSKAKEVYEELKYQLRDSLDPLAAYNRELDQHMELLKYSGERAKIEQEMLRVTQDLRAKGVKLTAEETAQLRAKLTVEQELSRIAEARDQLEANSISRGARNTSDSIQAGAQLANDPSSGVSAGDVVSQMSGSIPGLDKTSAYMDAQREQYAAYYAAIDEMRQLDLLSERDAAAAKFAIFQEQYATQFTAAQTALGQLASLQKSENKKQAQIGKAAAIAQTIIQTYQSAQGAFTAMASIPYVGPFLGAAAAAAAVAAGMANVQAIRSQNVAFRTGGSWTVGGSGGTDSQMVNFRATPGEKINVHTPAQARAIEKMGEDRGQDQRRGGVYQEVNIYQQGRPDRRTDEQQARQLRKSARREYDRVS